jgi:hypothetical protein
MKQRMPSEEYINFLRKYREEEIRFLCEHNLIFKYDSMNEFISDKIKNHLQYLMDSGFSKIEIEESFKGITLFNEKNLNI